MNTTDPEPVNEKPTAQGTSRTTPPPEEYANPAGVGGEVCEIDVAEEETEPCDPARAEDLVLEESKPGYGIAGYEGEEVGGG